MRLPEGSSLFAIASYSKTHRIPASKVLATLILLSWANGFDINVPVRRTHRSYNTCAIYKGCFKHRSDRCRDEPEYGMKYEVNYSFDLILFKTRQTVALLLLPCISITLIRLNLCLHLSGQWPLGHKHDSSLKAVLRSQRAFARSETER